MRKIVLSQVIEGIRYDIKRMYEDGISSMDISKYLQRKSLELTKPSTR